MIDRFDNHGLIILRNQSEVCDNDFEVLKSTLNKISNVFTNASQKNPDTAYIFSYPLEERKYYTLCAYNGKIKCGIYRYEDKKIYSMQDAKNMNSLFNYSEFAIIRAQNYIKAINKGILNVERGLIEEWQRKFDNPDIKIQLGEQYIKSKTYEKDDYELNEKQRAAYGRFLNPADKVKRKSYSNIKRQNKRQP